MPHRKRRSYPHPVRNLARAFLGASPCGTLASPERNKTRNASAVSYGARLFRTGLNFDVKDLYFS